MVGTPVTIAMYNRVHVGLVVTSHTEDENVCSATMTNVSVSTPVAAASVPESFETYNGESTFQVYPNPLQGNLLYVKSAAGLAGRMQIVNTLGQVIHEQHISEQSSGQTEVDMNPIPQGIYVVRLLNQGKTLSRSIVRK